MNKIKIKIPKIINSISIKNLLIILKYFKWIKIILHINYTNFKYFNYKNKGFVYVFAYKCKYLYL